MNYTSVQEILDAGITNATVIRNNSRNDDGTDTLTGVSWFTFNNTVASSIYVSGNTWFGFGANSEHLKVNRRDAASWYVYREEGTLWNHYQFLRIRWSGYSYYSQTSSSYLLTYDVILWDTGDISLHMVNIPTSNYDGTFNLVASTTVSYTKPTASSLDVTFYSQDSGNTVYTATNTLISLEPPYNKRYLLRENGVLYTVSNDELVEVQVSTLTAQVFMDYGVTNVPSNELILTLTDPELLCWIDDTQFENPLHGVTVTALPFPQTIYSSEIDLTSPDITGIESITATYEGSPVFAVSVDNTTWKIWDETNEQWVTLSDTTTGMTHTVMANIATSDWSTLIVGASEIYIRWTLSAETDTVTQVLVDYTN